MTCINLSISFFLNLPPSLLSLLPTNVKNLSPSPGKGQLLPPSPFLNTQQLYNHTMTLS